jgi:tRNA threonylcarbamoyladenosine biosynthesis protein TsaE
VTEYSRETPVKTGRLNEAEMNRLAAAMAAKVEPPLIVYLEGELGAGKTSFTRAFIRSLGYTGSVKSPTYGLLEKYPLDRFDIVHLDLYRIAQSGELEFLGIEDLCGGRAVFMIEWPDRGGKRLPPPDLRIRFKHRGDARSLHFLPQNSRSAALCRKLSEYFQ